MPMDVFVDKLRNTGGTRRTEEVFVIVGMRLYVDVHDVRRNLYFRYRWDAIVRGCTVGKLWTLIAGTRHVGYVYDFNVGTEYVFL